MPPRLDQRARHAAQAPAEGRAPARHRRLPRATASRKSCCAACASSVDAVLADAWQRGRPAGRHRAGRRRRLRPRRAVPLFRRRPPDPAGQRRPTPITQARLEALVQLLWDLGLEIGHSMRTVDECMSESAADITVQTSLLEARLVAGDAAAVRRSCSGATARRSTRSAFFQAKTAEMRQRHAKYEDTAFASSRTSRKARAACATCR